MRNQTTTTQIADKTAEPGLEPVTVDFLEKMATNLLKDEKTTRTEKGDLVAAGWIAMSELGEDMGPKLQTLVARRAMMDEMLKFRSPVTFPKGLARISDKTAAKYGRDGLKALVKQSLHSATVEELENPQENDGLGGMRKAFLAAITH